MNAAYMVFIMSHRSQACLEFHSKRKSGPFVHQWAQKVDICPTVRSRKLFATKKTELTRFPHYGPVHLIRPPLWPPFRYKIPF